MGGFGDVRRVTMSLHQFTSSISDINCIIFPYVIYIYDIYFLFIIYIYIQCIYCIYDIYVQFDLFSCLFVVLNRFNLANLVTGSVPEEA